MVTFYEAFERIKEAAKPLGRVEFVSLDGALRRVLANDIRAFCDSPEAPTSAMDGYAIKSADLGSDIRVCGKIQAGDSEIYNIKSGETYKIFTGALLPDGADTVVMVEQCTEENGLLKIEGAPKQGDHVRQIGSSYQKGEILLEKGTKITPIEISLLASLGISEVAVVGYPRVGVISFGEELLGLGEIKTKASEIYSANNYAIKAYLQELGIEAVNLGITKDSYEASKKSILDALQSFDVVVTTGGMSMGDFDFIKEILKEIDAQEVFKGVKMKPGKPVGIYQKDDRFVIGLPGYPNSAFVTFSIFGRALLGRLYGVEIGFKTIKAVLRDDIVKKGERLEFYPMSVELDEGQIYASAEKKRHNSSAIINNLSQDTALAMLPKEGVYKAGESVELFFYKNVFGC